MEVKYGVVHFFFGLATHICLSVILKYPPNIGYSRLGFGARSRSSRAIVPSVIGMLPPEERISAPNVAIGR